MNFLFIFSVGLKHIQFTSDDKTLFPQWSKIPMFSIVSLTGVIWQSETAG